MFHPLSECGTYKTVKARFWSWLSGKISWNLWSWSSLLATRPLYSVPQRIDGPVHKSATEIISNLKGLVFVPGSSTLANFSWFQLISLVNISAHRCLILQKVFTKMFCEHQFPHKSVDVSFIITKIRDQLTNLCGNLLLQNDFLNCSCAIMSVEGGDYNNNTNPEPWTLNPNPGPAQPQPRQGCMHGGRVDTNERLVLGRWCRFLINPLSRKSFISSLKFTVWRQERVYVSF